MSSLYSNGSQLGSVLLPWGHLAMSVAIFHHQDWWLVGGRGVVLLMSTKWRSEMLLYILQYTELSAPPPKNYLAPNADSAEVEKMWAARNPIMVFTSLLLQWPKKI